MRDALFVFLEKFTTNLFSRMSQVSGSQNDMDGQETHRFSQKSALTNRSESQYEESFEDEYALPAV